MNPLRIDYPRRGKTGVRHFLPSWRQWLLVFGLGTFAVVATFVVLYAVIDVPKPNDAALAQSTILYYSDGKSELGRFGEANRTIIPLDQIPQTLRYAVMAAEDRKFYDEGGISVTGIARAAWNDLAGGSLQGGSTITQQLVKNYYLTQDRTVSRKVNEFIVSIKIDQALSKDEILTDYLNTIYFGRGAYGVQAAARAYFGTTASALTPSQAAVLASVIRSPGGYSPTAHLDKLMARWNFVLDGEVSQGWLTPADRAAQVFPTKFAKRSTVAAGPQGYLTAYVQAELASRGYSDDDINRRGLRIVTTFNKGAEAAAIAAVRDNRPTTNAVGVRVGLASIDPVTGGIVAMYGGPDYGNPQYINDATQSIAQAGSTFKAFTLVAALENGITLDSTWDGKSGRVFTDVNGSKTKPIPNEDGRSYGRISLLQATEDSVNTVFVDVENQVDVGAAKVVDAARRAGIPSDVVIDPVLSATLGVASPTALDMASAYGTFAAGGMQTGPTSIAKIIGPNNGLLYELTPKGSQTISPEIVSQVDYALQKVVTSGTGTKARQVGRPVAGKTGTTDSNLSAWFVGYTPQLSTSVVLFRTEADGKTRKSMNGVGGLSRVNGGSFPALIWTKYMSVAVKGMPVVAFPPLPAGIPTASPSPTITPSPSPSPTLSPTPTPSGSPSPSPTPTPSDTTTPTPTPTATTSPIPSPPIAPGAPLTPGEAAQVQAGILGPGDRRPGAAGSR